MIKKLFAVAVLAMSMAMVSCGSGDKANEADSTQVEAVTGNAEADALIAKIKACKTMDELNAIAPELAKFQNDQAVLEAIMKAGDAKTEELNAQNQTTVLEEVNVEEVVPTDDVNALLEEVQSQAQDLPAQAVQAGQDVAAKAVQAGQDAAAKAVQAGQDAAAKAVQAGQAAASKAVGL